MSWYDAERAKQLIGKRALVGITVVDPGGKVVDQYQLSGEIIRIREEEGVIVLRLGSGEEYTLPPNLDAFQPATPGRYTLRSTGEVVVDPDLLAAWTVQRSE